jgi:hypothetical protein
MKFISPFISILLFIPFLVSAQSINRCATIQYQESKALNDNTYNSIQQQIQANIQQHAINTVNRANDEILRIPVVVHVLYNNEVQNISDERVFAQIDRLNQDYRRLNEDASLTRTEFLPVAADAKIEFFLAQWDPQGNQSNGITRTQTSQSSFWVSLTNMKSSSTGGIDAWDVNHYLNIWVCNMALPIVNLPLVLGFATPPSGAPNWPDGSAAETPQEDGVVIHYEVFGPNPSLSGALLAVNQGRTATHEIGHYLGLRHIWGDGDCSADDGLSDTPSASQAQQQTCDYTSNTCTDSLNDLPDMLENFMDYSDENCMNTFTQQQVSAMRFVIQSYRNDLLLSQGSKIQSSLALNIYPNPANEFLNIEALMPNLEIKSIIIVDLSGRVVKKELSSLYAPIQLSDLSSGIYLINIHTNQGLIVHKFIHQ